MSLAEAPATLDPAATQNAVQQIVARHGEAVRAAATRGVRQVAARWTAEDGDAASFAEFCATNFAPPGEARTRLLDRLERAMTSVSGHLYEIRRDLRWWTDVRTDSFAGVDDVLARFDASLAAAPGAPAIAKLGRPLAGLALRPKPGTADRDLKDAVVWYDAETLAPVGVEATRANGRTTVILRNAAVNGGLDDAQRALLTLAAGATDGWRVDERPLPPAGGAK